MEAEDWRQGNGRLRIGFSYEYITCIPNLIVRQNVELFIINFKFFKNNFKKTRRFCATIRGVLIYP